VVHKSTTASGAVALVAFAELAVYLDVAPLRIVGGLALALCLPGWVITQALSARFMSERSTRLLLIPVLSISTLVIAGMLLYALGIPLTSDSWAVALGALTLGGVGAWALRDRRQAARIARDVSDPDHDGPDMDATGSMAPRGQPPHVAGTSGGEEDGLLGPREEARHSVERRPRSRGLVPRIVVLTMLLTAAIEATGAVLLASSGQRRNGPAFTQLWALPSQHKPFTVAVGVRSYQRHPAHYQIAVTINQRVVMRRAVALAPTRMWQSTLALGDQVGQRVDVTLRMSPSHSVYRHVRIWTGDAAPAPLVLSGLLASVATARPRTLHATARGSAAGRYHRKSQMKSNRAE
jgi:hypothetical protein